MRLLDIFLLSLSHVKKSRMRSWLTIIGVIIGVASVVAIISIGQGMQENMQERLGNFGADIITVIPGYFRATGVHSEMHTDRSVSTSSSINLTDKDYKVVKQVPGVMYVNGIVSGKADIVYDNEKTVVSVTGVDTSVWRLMDTTGIDEGRYLQTGDSNSIVVGYNLAYGTFLQPVTLNRPLTVGGKNFRVVGILKQSGGFGGGSDTAVYMPAEMARGVITEKVANNQFTSMVIKASDASLVESIKDDIDQKLMSSRQVNPRTKDFTVIASALIREQMSGVTQTLSLFLSAIAAVSLLVGAIGIANTMFMSVMERTKQIGLLKAMGAGEREIMKLFLIEAGMFGFVGGIIGVVFGSAISLLIPFLGVQALGFGGDMRATITAETILFALGFSVVIGILSGIIPARYAARMRPVDAIRYDQ
ncbi:ABC-type antimicrobial peptide transport system, permease component [Candidatus Methanoperedens nitroreducens]|uniref:ABC-type antimicrobial peptide transport system, permease component n=1 Tax=Candidatus Methanoperedens nitratireducens TaxID=1392998 RepID=A0A062UUP2_9EURY|nr:ABC transporter permease [Candidatus Methanoperedens nitroreducens]KCZ70751.1 ABC-type antimicrobial peptide transport system, permease component [Candidatus Methanoperedens nitroreducens]MDJ1420608.1 ABC transporter permease [Candidatus Methanoperedens sp.]